MVIAHDSLSEIGAAEAENGDQMVLRLCRHVSHVHMAIKRDRKCREFPISLSLSFCLEVKSSFFPFFFARTAKTCSFQSVLLKMRNLV